MERASFLVEASGECISFLLNPASVVLRRVAGVRSLRSAGGKLAGSTLRDDPLIHTGGGYTELTLDLLFDVHLAGSSLVTRDVRDLTRPLWDWSEVGRGVGVPERSPRLLFIWGKTWNVPVVIAALSERLEVFTAEGVPARSWMRIRLLRVDATEETAARIAELAGPEPGPETSELLEAGPLAGPTAELEAFEAEASSGELAAVERARRRAERQSGTAEDWRDYME